MSNSREFKYLLQTGQPLFLDGAMGTMLQAAGMPTGIGPDIFCLQNQDILRSIHRRYIEAGANIITTCTFGANKYKLSPGMDVFGTNRTLASIAVSSAREGSPHGPVFVAGDIGPTGVFARPLGPAEPAEMIDAFADQARGLAAAGVDAIIIETQFDLAEARLAVVGARQACDLPVMVSMTFENGVSLTGSTPEIFCETMLNMGVAAVGVNCSLGPDELPPIVEELLRHSTAPVLVQPNAGLPALREGKTIFPLGPEAFAEKTARFAPMGVRLLGGCCGTTPAHIRALAETVSAMRLSTPPKNKASGICLTSRSRIARAARDQPLMLIGERINPTGKPKLAAQLSEGGFAEAFALAEAQVEAGAAVLDVNVGAPMIDETTLLPNLVRELAGRVAIPLSIDSSSTAAIAAALPYAPGSFLVNSISGEGSRMEELGPLCRDFGAPFILLPLSGARLPETAAQRIAIVEKLISRAAKLRIPERLIMVDILALAVSSSPTAARECLKMARWCAEAGLATTIGLSNISFGLPARSLLNAVFLAMARGAGLASCIANPGVSRLAETADAMNALLGHDAHAESFISAYSQWKPDSGSVSRTMAKNTAGSLRDAVLLGAKEEIDKWIDRELGAGADPFALVNDSLIPAITEVGEKYERREYFLPQLIRSAETMQAAFSRLKPLMEAARGPEKRPVIVLATVEGDIHDIGKNIVGLLLGNHGFEVIDAGKDVPAAKILECAEKHGASLIGLSALMTTTMVRMEDTIKLVRERNLPIRVLVGGAAVTPEFASSIGADSYCADAVATVRAAREFTSTAS